MNAPRILLVPDCGPSVGGGHVMRCLTLARALAAQGAECRFLAQAEAGALLDAFGGGGIALTLLPGSGGVAVLPDAAAAAAGAADVMVIDHYRFGAEVERQLRPARLVVLEDLPNRPHECDLLVDSGLTHTPEHYAPMAPGARVLTGPPYALVRPEFAELRPATLQRRRQGGPVRRVLVGLGLTDLEETTCRVLEGLRNDFGRVQVDVCTGRAAPSLDCIQELVDGDVRFHLHLDTPHMAELMAAADIAIGAGGSSVWERACLGLPSITVVLAENQRPLTSELHRLGATLALDRFALAFEAMLSGEWYGLLASPEARLRMTEASAALCDGLGAPRVAEAVLALLQ
ncbi:MAG TPA: UDP-2,4-diacetamido-2,4,6-trideoxy-beta-L-altropyranose hydrolase [Caulobacteraceae bacterium]|jgi:UDP-2,4-diacetamido-2,4,6-trideoxy-beta-L-altropyranose hydrolase